MMQRKIKIKTTVESMLADVYTPVGIYLRIRDKFRDTILLESADSNVVQNSWSFIGVNAIGGVEMVSSDSVEIKFPAEKEESVSLTGARTIEEILQSFMDVFDISTDEDQLPESRFAQGLYGYCTYDAVQFFETIPGAAFKNSDADIPLLRYRLYQYVIAINHFKDELFLCENKIDGIDGDRDALLSLITGMDVPVYPFQSVGQVKANMTDDDHLEMVRKGIAHCHRGDVFQIVLSRRFEQSFIGDEFNVYRALRNINPSPYLFYFDYGDYKLMGSSPESQLIVADGKAIIHPIAGTVRRTGDTGVDAEATISLQNDPKENAEHVMLVDLARNDLSRGCTNVSVSKFKEVQYFSHVIHLVSEVKGDINTTTSTFNLFTKTFPAGTLSGAPKIKAMELISRYEPTARSFYGGAVGFFGFDGSCNKAIMIRSFLSRNNVLTRQAGGGIVAASNPDAELQEVKNKLGALEKAIQQAEKIR